MIAISGHTAVAAVIGCPVLHSLSPLLFNAAFDELGLDWRFVAFEVTAGRASDALAAMKTLGLRGLSVTMPHKDDVARLVDHPTVAVRALGACNSVVRLVDGSLEGHNTDGDGLLDALVATTGRGVAGLSVVVLGAGGAARSIIEAAGRAGAREVVVLNRSADRARVAAALTSAARVGTAADVSVADVVVNATSVGMELPGRDAAGERALPIDPAWLRAGQVVVDIVYRPLETPLLRAAAERGAQSVDGLGMLIHQAGRQLRIWTGFEPPLAAMTTAARAFLAGATG